MKPLFDDPKEQSLIQRVGAVFLEKGIKSMTMDTIASELHVSKKTLYKYVKNRGELVHKVISLRVYHEKTNRTMIQAAGLNAVEENLKILEFATQLVKRANPEMHEDLEKYFPDSFALIEDYKNNFLFESVVKNIEKGISEGFYSDLVNPGILAKMYIAKIDLVFDGKTFPPAKFKFADVIHQIIIHNMRGMATAKGLQEIEKLTGQKFK